MQILVKSTKKGIDELKKKTTQKYSCSEKFTQKAAHPPGTSPPPLPIPVQSSVEETALCFSYEQKFQILRKVASVMSWS